MGRTPLKIATPNDSAQGVSMNQCVHDHSAYPSKWGPDDRQGAANILTPAYRLRALGLVEHGDVFDLSHVIENGAPRIAPNQTPYVLTLSARADNVIRRRRDERRRHHSRTHRNDDSRWHPHRCVGARHHRSRDV